VNCGSRGCPRLLAQPFEAATVRAKLAELERAAIHSTSRLVQVEGRPVLEVLELFSWYGKDFTGIDPGGEPEKHQKALRSYILARLSEEDRARFAGATTIRARSDWDWHVNSK
jgi:hypothetical protein